jgi:hypothetical protein
MDNSVSMTPAGHFLLDLAASNDAAEIDRGKRETIKGIRLSILGMGIGLANIEAKSLYEDLGFQKMSQYIQRFCNDTKMDRSSVYAWLHIGESYLKYQTELKQIDFNDNDGPTKLPFLDRALEENQKQEVFGNIKSMSVREFAIFSKGLSGKDRFDSHFIIIKNHNVYVDGLLAVKINKKLDWKAGATPPV